MAYGFSDTRLVFNDKQRYRALQWAYTLSFVAVLKRGTVLGAAVGTLAGGELYGAGDHWQLRPGVLWSFTVARRFLGNRPAVPFLLVAGIFSGSSASTVRDADGQRVGLHAFDAKADLSVGWTLGDAWSPYLAVRAFGGPVLWKPDDQARLGSDLYHVSLAAGFNLNIANRTSVYFDGAFLGMRGMSAGLAVRF
ncbi:MAG: hypothetical protein KC431_03675 [Myxococcales bacterium]|nr:hypothetical protein [Myxococcales bacterium]